MAVATSIGASLPGGAAQAATTTSSTTTSSTAVKAPVSGLMDRHHPPKAAYAGVVRGHVVNTTWAAVQPVKGGPIVHPNPIDQAIAVAKKNGYALKLRVRAGMKAISTVPRSLDTVDVASAEPAKAIHQRSDVCAVPAAGVVAEAMVALVLAEAGLE